MTNFDFIHKCTRLQEGIMFDKVEDLGFGTLVYCVNDKIKYWNFVHVDKLITEDELSLAARKLRELDRQPAVYFENREDLKSLRLFLESKNYQRSGEDSWMFHPGDNIDMTGFSAVKKIIYPEDLNIFLKVFNACYQKNDPQNPYDELGDNYLAIARDVWLKFQGTGRLEYYVVYKGVQPVAVSALTNFEGIGYISNVGSLRAVRGQGFGKLATLFAVTESVKNGNTEHCLATEEGTYPNQFYKLIGFITRFTTPVYVLDS